jgi:hypothetical protein
MKKIIVSILLVLTAVFLITCEQKDLYTNTEDKALSLLGVNVDVPVIIPAPTAIYIYAYTPSTVDGNLGGRGGADAMCQSIVPPPGTTVVQAFLSASPTQIRDLVPSLYQGLPVLDAGGAMLISNTWNDLWTVPSGINMSLSSAGVLGGGAEWWNGSNLDGTFNVNNCDGGSGAWTTNSNAYTGESGNSNAPTPLAVDYWINWAAITCNTTQYLLCVAY